MSEQQSMLDELFQTNQPKISDQIAGAILELANANLASKMTCPTFFVVPLAGKTSTVCEAARSALTGFQKKGVSLPLVEICLSAEDLIKSGINLDCPDLKLQCFAIDTRSVESVKDKLKESLWPVWALAPAGPTVSRQDLLCNLVFTLSAKNDSANNCKPRRRLLALKDHGFFSPVQKPPQKDISIFSYDHGGGHFYRYRFSNSKITALPPPLEELRRFLWTVAADCPNHFFKTGPRMSAIDWKTEIKCDLIEDHQISKLAREALVEPRYKAAHDNVEVYCVENDISTVAVEIPVWLEPGELKAFSSLFSPHEALTGHIDIMRCVDGRIEIWDYKPNAAQETTAGLQVFLYAIAVAIRTSMPLAMFRCGYFDGDTAFTFDPSKTSISLFDETSKTL